MKKSVKIVLLLYLAAFFLIALSALFNGIMAQILYLSAFAVPLFFSFFASGKLKDEREKERGISLPSDRLFTLRAKDAGLLLPLIAPTVSAVFLFAYLTSIALSALGLTNTAPEMGGIAEMLLLHALLPCVLEEMLFRYIPMKLILPESKRACIAVSSLAFAIFHVNAFQIPYALLAGVIFIFIDILFESILPSVVIHFVNNAVSVIWMTYCPDLTFARVFVSVLFGFSIVSAAFIICFYKKYKDRIMESFKNINIPSVGIEFFDE